MAKHVIVQLVDDIDQSPIADGRGEHIEFSVNGIEYEIDLNAKNAKEFHRKLDYYIEYGTKIGRRKKPAPSAPAPKRDREQLRAIREWAIASGYEVSSRGRIPGEIQEAFDAAH